jgi:hypothetical protein
VDHGSQNQLKDEPHKRFAFACVKIKERKKCGFQNSHSINPLCSFHNALPLAQVEHEKETWPTV